jgi:hypothetical protein
MGTGKEEGGEEYLRHATGAFPPGRVKLGVRGAQRWPRPGRPVGHQRKSKPMEETEGVRGLEGDAVACAVQQGCPQPVVGSGADCEGESRERVLDAMHRWVHERAEVLIRAQCTRRLAPGAAHDSLWEAMQAARPLGKLTFKWSRQADRRARRGTLRGAAMLAPFTGARRPGGRLPPGQA